MSLEAADKVLLGRSSSGVWRKRGERLDSVTDKEKLSSFGLKQAYQAIEERYGEKARRFLNALTETGWRERINVAEASKVAGISRKTGDKYLRKLKFELEKKLPARKK